MAQGIRRTGLMQAQTKDPLAAMLGVDKRRVRQDFVANESELERAFKQKQFDEEMALDREKFEEQKKQNAEARAARGRARADKKAQAAAIRGALTSFNTPTGINTGLETQNYTNAAYEAPTVRYNQLSAAIADQKSNNQNIIDTLDYENANKGDAIRYDGDGKIIEHPGRKNLMKTQFELDQQQQNLDTMFNSLTPKNVSSVGDKYLDDLKVGDKALTQEILDPNKLFNDVAPTDEYKPETDLLGILAKQGNTQLDVQQGVLDTKFGNKIDNLNETLQGAYSRDPQLLDKITNPNRIANELYQKMLKDGVDPTTAASTAKTWLANNPVKEIDKNLVTSIKDEKKALLDSIAEETNKVENGKLSSSRGGSNSTANNLSLKAGETPANSAYNYLKLNNVEGWFDSFTSDGRKALEDKETEIRKKLKAEGKSFTDKQIAQALVHGVRAGLSRGDSMVIDTGKALHYLNNTNFDNTAADKKTTRTVKQKAYTPEQKQKLADINARLAAAQSPQLTPRKVLGKDFVKAASTDPKLIDALKAGKAPSNPTKPTVTPVKPKSNIKDTLEDTKEVKTKEQELVSEAKKLNTKKVKKPKKKVPFKNIDEYYKAADARTAVKKELPSLFSTDTWKKAPEGAKIKFMQAIEHPADTAKDFGLGIMNIIPGFTSFVGDVLNIDTPSSDRATAAIRSNLSDKNALAFDLGELVGGGSGARKTAYGITNGTKLGNALTKSRTAPSLGTALGKTVNMPISFIKNIKNNKIRALIQQADKEAIKKGMSKIQREKYLKNKYEHLINKYKKQTPRRTGRSAKDFTFNTTK